LLPLISINLVIWLYSINWYIDIESLRAWFWIAVAYISWHFCYRHYNFR
jgi:hypothetical protein